MVWYNLGNGTIINSLLIIAGTNSFCHHSDGLLMTIYLTPPLLVPDLDLVLEMSCNDVSSRHPPLQPTAVRGRYLSGSWDVNTHSVYSTSDGRERERERVADSDWPRNQCCIKKTLAATSNCVNCVAFLNQQHQIICVIACSY